MIVTSTAVILKTGTVEDESSGRFERDLEREELRDGFFWTSFFLGASVSTLVWSAGVFKVSLQSGKVGDESSKDNAERGFDKWALQISPVWWLIETSQFS